MSYPIDDTHDPKLKSWVESADDPSSDFPVQNLPFCVVDRAEEPGETDPRICVAIGDQLLDLLEVSSAGLLGADDGDIAMALQFETLDDLAALPTNDRRRLRMRLVELLTDRSDDLRADDELVEAALFPREGAEFLLPFEVRDYTDFYASVFHATNVGSMFRPDNPLLPNYKWIPVGYHGRASSIVVSGTPVRRPMGQLLPGATIDDGPPEFGPCKLLDYELEVGFYVGRGNELGRSIPIDKAEEHIFGLCLVNDWSARDVQKWEYQPLGPFLAKSFATSVSPFVVPLEALTPYRCAALERSPGDPAPLPHLTSDLDREAGGIDLKLEVLLATSEMRKKGLDPVRLSTGNLRDMYWTVAQMLTHHASNGCNMRPGDLLASGTVSGPKRESRGCLLELTWDGDPFANPPVSKPGAARTPIKLPTGEERKFLADGDEVILRGYCERDGFRRVGFGECRGVVLPAGD